MAIRRAALVAGLAALAGPLVAAAPAVACPPKPSAADQAVTYAMSKIGKPYVYAAEGPNSFDGPGLIVAAYASAGVTLTHNKDALLDETTPIEAAEVQPGDVVFYGTDSASAVAIAVGDGKVVGAWHTGTYVSLKLIDWNTVFSYRRVPV